MIIIKSFVVRNSDGDKLAEVTGVLSCSSNDTVAGVKTLDFSTLLDGGLESLNENERYTVDFEEELYDVASFKKSMNGNLCFIDFSCEHISYRLNDYTMDYFSVTGTPKEILTELLQGTGFSVSDEVPTKEVTYSVQKSMTIRAILLDFAAFVGYEAVFSRYSVSLVSHRGDTEYKKIIDKNVLEISKSADLTDNSVSYSLKLKPKTEINVGDEVHLVFGRLGIDDKIRVVGIKREPLISDNITLEVGTYQPDVAEESVRIITNMVSTEKNYYGTRISADNGIEINREDEKAKVIFNADKMAFYQGDEEVLYFDPVEKIWKMTASVEVHISDSEGNDTTISALSNGLVTRIEDADKKYIEIKETVDGFTVTNDEGETLIDGGMIVTDNIQLHRLIAKGSPNSYVEMLTNGLNFVLGNENTIGIGYASAEIPLPYIIFGEGAAPESDDSGMIKFYEGGLWLGDSADRHTDSITDGTGLFVDVSNDKIYLYVKGEQSEIVNYSQVTEILSGYKPVAVFG